MALKAVVDAVPAGLEEHYIADGDKFRLSVESAGGLSLEDVGGLKRVLAETKADKDKLRTALAKFGDADPDAVRAALDAMPELEEFRKLDPRAEADKLAQAKIEAAIKKASAAHKSELDALTGRNAALSATVDDVLRKQAATKALADAAGSVDLLLPHVLGRTRVVEADGKYSVEVLDTEGSAMLDNSGKPLTLAAFVAEMKASDTFAPAFGASGVSGSGKGPTSGGGTAGAKVTMTRSQFDALPPAEKMSAAQKGVSLTD